MNSTPNVAPSSYAYAGFWRRFFAMVIDNFIVSSLTVLVMMPLILWLGGSVVQATLAGEKGLALFLAVSLQLFSAFSVNILLSWAYFAGLEASKFQATPGKMLLKIRVSDMDGKRASLGKVTGRYFAKIFSAVLLMIGFLIQPFTARRQALHDKMSGCLVIRAPAPAGELEGKNYGIILLAFIILFFLQNFISGILGVELGEMAMKTLTAGLPSDGKRGALIDLQKEMEKTAREMEKAMREAEGAARPGQVAPDRSGLPQSSPVSDEEFFQIPQSPDEPLSSPDVRTNPEPVTRPEPEPETWYEPETAQEPEYEHFQSEEQYAPEIKHEQFEPGETDGETGGY